MKIINLMEDTQGERDLFAEHGFCVYIEVSTDSSAQTTVQSAMQNLTQKLLVDTGASEKTWENAKRLGVDVKDVDFVILSHGHYDHSGGILSFAEQNPDAEIYMHQDAGGDYYHLKGSREKYIGIDKRILELSNIRLLEDGCRINPQVTVYSGVTGRRKWPKSNLKLKKKEGGEYVQDSFSHEQYVVVEENGKRALISGCAHNGILNILDKYMEIYQSAPDVLISGFHMVKGGDYNMEEIKLIQDVAKELSGFTNTRFYTGHCTGAPAFLIMKEIMKDRLIYMHTGDAVYL